MKKQFSEGSNSGRFSSVKQLQHELFQRIPLPQVPSTGKDSCHISLDVSAFSQQENVFQADPSDVSTKPMSSSTTTTTLHKISTELLPHEVTALLSLQTSECVIEQSAVVEVLFAHPNPRQWHPQCIGVVCFVNDRVCNSFYLRVFDVEDSLLLWEQEVYDDFVYRIDNNFFHTFASDNFEVGLNFALEVEASQFGECVQNRLEMVANVPLMAQKGYFTREVLSTYESNSSGSDSMSYLSTQTINNVPPPCNVEFSTCSSHLNPLTQHHPSSKKKEKGGNKSKKKTLQIGSPTHFQHVHHISGLTYGDVFLQKDVPSESQELIVLIRSMGMSVSDMIQYLKYQGNAEKLRQEIREYKKHHPPI